MPDIHYKYFTLEALKITLFCLIVTVIFNLFGASDQTLLVVFNMAVMSSAATFSVKKKHLSHVVLGGSTIILSIILGGVIGYYFPSIAMPLTIIYAGLSFYLPKTKTITNIFVTSTVVFFIFTALPFDSKTGIFYALDGVIVLAIFIGFYWLFDRKIRKSHQALNDEPSQDNHLNAIITVLSLILTGIITHYLHRYSSLSHLYWIGLTVLVVIQSSQQKMIHTSIKRICVNALGAIIAVFLFSYIMPPDFWINFTLLVLFLFLIFFLGFSYTGRTLFIELFVLGFTHLLGDYHNIIAWDRFILTLIGGAIVIFISLISHMMFKRLIAI